MGSLLPAPPSRIFAMTGRKWNSLAMAFPQHVIATIGSEGCARPRLREAASAKQGAMAEAISNCAGASAWTVQIHITAFRMPTVGELPAFASPTPGSGEQGKAAADNAN